MSLLRTVPLPGAQVTQQNIIDHQTRGIIPRDITAFHAIESFAAGFGGSLPYVPSMGDVPKYWADLGQPAEYVTVSGTLDTQDAATWSDFSMHVYGKTIATFYQERAAANDPVFRYIPRFKKFEVAYRGSLNLLADVGRKVGPRMVTPGEAPYPLAKSAPDTVTGWTWPTNHAMRLNPENKLLVEVFDYQEYTQAFPVKYTPSVGSGASGSIRVKGMTDEAFLSASAAAIFGTGTPADRVAKVISNLEVK